MKRIRAPFAARAPTWLGREQTRAGNRYSQRYTRGEREGERDTAYLRFSALVVRNALFAVDVSNAAAEAASRTTTAVASALLTLSAEAPDFFRSKTRCTAASCSFFASFVMFWALVRQEADVLIVRRASPSGVVLSRGLRSRRYALAEFSRARVFCGHAAARRFCSGLKAACARPRGEKLLLAGDTQNVFHTRPHARRSLACVLEMTGGPETVLPSPICLRVGLYFETVISSPAWP